MIKKIDTTGKAVFSIRVYRVGEAEDSLAIEGALRPSADPLETALIHQVGVKIIEAVNNLLCGEGTAFGEVTSTEVEGTLPKDLREAIESHMTTAALAESKGQEEWPEDLDIH